MGKKKAAEKDGQAPAWGGQLVLFRYFLNLFGKGSLAALAGRLNASEYEGVDESQNTFFWRELDGIVQRQGESARISRDSLRECDENICRHVRRIGENRGGIKLKYFQYIACLFTEMYLGRYFADRDGFARELNDYAEWIKEESAGAIDAGAFAPGGMNKLAFMCATGSGKTLVMHINILQFGHYLGKARLADPRLRINKIIVLAPNEGMSAQHLAELKLSSISAEAFVKSGLGNQADVVVIDMNKLKEEGKVKTVSVDSFEQNNLVLVDEAHRGLAGDVWHDYRSRLSADPEKGGFAFEYSATLKQAMRAGKPSAAAAEEWKGRLGEYFRSIVIDYSYKFFHEDGYGKEYRIYNLREGILEEQRQLYLVGCLLSFYQQLKLFGERGKDYAPFCIEKPLLVFVGNRVTAKTSAAEMTDVEEVLGFIDGFVRNAGNSTVRDIHAVLRGSTGLTDGGGRDFFRHEFGALSGLFGGAPAAGDVYRDMLRVVFGADAAADGPRLHLLNLRQAQGEIAMRVGKGGADFGVISIGDAAGLIRNCAAKGISVGTDEFAGESLFGRINEKNSDISVLIGSRKFTEGWNSWRVSTMGLVNFARGEGSQAIQLFGRGVRLRGFGGSLKRSGKLDGRDIAVPKHLSLLETLSIFGIKAQYMEDFRKHLEAEDMPEGGKLREWTLAVCKDRHNPIRDKRLRVIKLRDGADFKKQAARLVLGAPDEGFARYLGKNKVRIDCRSKVQALESVPGAQAGGGAPGEEKLDGRFLPFLDYERILDELAAYKNEKLYHGIALGKSGLRSALQSDGWYALVVPKARMAFGGAAHLSMYTDFAIIALKSYMDKFYRYEKARWEEPHLEYRELAEDDANFVDGYTLTYHERHAGDAAADGIDVFVRDLQALLDKKGGLPASGLMASGFPEPGVGLAALDFGRHLYAPLIFKDEDLKLELAVSPAGLNKGEKLFVEKLAKYARDNEEGALAGKSLYLLRNKSKIGMGFFAAGNFYPDFVLWVDAPDAQHVSFIDPKGLRFVGWDDPKIRFCETIKEREALLQPTSPDKRIALNSFIMSSTPSADLRAWWGKSEPELHARNVFCLDEPDSVGLMMRKILGGHARNPRA